VWRYRRTSARIRRDRFIPEPARPRDSEDVCHALRAPLHAPSREGRKSPRKATPKLGQMTAFCKRRGTLYRTSSEPHGEPTIGCRSFACRGSGPFTERPTAPSTDSLTDSFPEQSKIVLRPKRYKANDSSYAAERSGCASLRIACTIAEWGCFR